MRRENYLGVGVDDRIIEIMFLNIHHIKNRILQLKIIIKIIILIYEELEIYIVRGKNLQYLEIIF